MKTIVFFTESLGNGGKERRMGELIRSLKHSGDYRIFLVLYSKVFDYEYVCKSLDGMFFIEEKQNKLQRLKNLYRFMKEVKPDYVQVWTVRACLLINFIRPFIKFKYILSSIADANKDSLSIRMLYQFTFPICDCVISNSQAGLDTHNAPKKKSRVIYNGFNKDRLDPKETGKRICEEFNLENKIVIAMAARVNPSKDFKMFLDTAKAVNKKSNNTVFLVIGKGDDEDMLKNHAKENNIDNVIFCGYRTDIEAIYKASDIAVLFTNPSVHAEGVSNSIMEAMACGLPVVATNGGGTPEIVIDGHNGFLIEPHDVDTAAERIIRLINDSDIYKNLSDNARKKIDSKFSIEKMTKEYIEEYN